MTHFMSREKYPSPALSKPCVSWTTSVRIWRSAGSGTGAGPVVGAPVPECTPAVDDAGAAECRSADEHPKTNMESTATHERNRFIIHLETGGRLTGRARDFCCAGMLVP